MRSEKEHKDHVDKTKLVIKEALDCVNNQIGLGNEACLMPTKEIEI